MPPGRQPMVQFGGVGLVTFPVMRITPFGPAESDVYKRQESNWLPAPAGKFQLMLRLYWPNENNPSLINGSWKIPQVKKVS